MGTAAADRIYLTTEELAARIKYDVRTIRARLKDSVLIEGRHYIRPFGRRKILYCWDVIAAELAGADGSGDMIPLARGSICGG
jgi:hypothetical protein